MQIAQSVSSSGNRNKECELRFEFEFEFNRHGMLHEMRDEQNSKLN